MSDKPITIEIPEDLLTSIQTAQIDIRQVVIEAFRREITGLLLEKPSKSTPDFVPPAYPTDEEIEAAIKVSETRLASPDAPRRILGLHKGTIWVSDDFDDELPDEFWLGEDA